jgi:fibronectin type 3 domain-containing protein
MKHIRLFLLFSLSTFLFFGCSPLLENWFDVDTKASFTISFEQSLKLPYKGKLVILDGSGSVAGLNEKLSYIWNLECPADSTATLSIPDPNNTSKAQFRPDKPGIYSVTLTVTDPTGDTDFQTVSVDVLDKPASAPSSPTSSDVRPTSIKLNWNAVLHATSYTVYRDNASTGSFSYSVGTSASTEYVDSTVEPGSQYFYTIEATNPAGASDSRSTIVEVITSLVEPTNFRSLGNTTDSVNLAWEESLNATGYIIEASKHIVGGFVEVATPTNTTSQVSGLDDSSVYYFRIKSTNSLAQSAWTNTVRVNLSLIPPATPTNVHFTDGTQTSLSLSWNVVDKATYYKVYRSNQESGPFTIIKDNQTNVPYLDSKLEPGQQYWYKIQAVLVSIEDGQREDISSDFSSVASATTIPPAPRNIIVSANSGTNTTLSWDASRGATHYRIFLHSPATNTSSIEVDPAVNKSGTSYEISNLTANTSYAVEILAANAMGNSPLSPQFAWNTQLLPLPGPSGIAVKQIRETTAELEWAPVPGAVRYNVYVGKDLDTPEFYTPANTTSITLKGLQGGTQYSVAISSINQNQEEGAKSNLGQSLLTIPSKPSGLSVSELTSTSVKISWPVVKGASEYILYRATSRYGTYNDFPSTSERIYPDNTLTEERDYWYTLAARNATGIGEQSDPIQITTPAFIPRKPELDYGIVRYNRIQLTWDSEPGVTYDIYRNNFLHKPNVNDDEYDDFSVISGTSYSYYIVGVSSRGTRGTASNSIYIGAPKLTISSPNGGTYVTNKTMNITWNTVGISGSTVDITYDNSNTIKSSASNNGSYSWTVPGTLSSGIHTIQVKDRTTFATDSKNFTVVKPPSYSNLSVTPNPANTEEKFTVEWVASGDYSSDVKITLSGPKTHSHNFENSDSGKQEFDIPNDAPTGSYTIRVEDLNDSSAYVSKSSLWITSVHDGSTTLDIGNISSQSHFTLSESQRKWVSKDEPTEKILFTLTSTTRPKISVNLYNMYGLDGKTADLDMYLYEDATSTLVAYGIKSGANTEEYFEYKAEKNVTYRLEIHHYSGSAAKYQVYIQNLDWY